MDNKTISLVGSTVELTYKIGEELRVIQGSVGYPLVLSPDAEFWVIKKEETDYFIPMRNIELVEVQEKNFVKKKTETNTTQYG